MASYNEAIASRMEPESGRFHSIITYYKATEFKKLADSTKRVWSPWIDRISEYFGNLSIAQLNRTERMRPASGNGAANTATRPAPPTRECRFFPAFYPMGETRWES